MPVTATMNVQPAPMTAQAEPCRTPRRSRPLRSAGWVVIVLLLLLVTAYIYQYVTRGRVLRQTFLEHATKLVGRDVKIGGDFQLYLHPNIHFVAEHISIANPDWAKDRVLFDAGRVDAEISLWDLILGKQHVRALLLADSNIGLELDKSGRNTWTFADDKPFVVPPIDSATVSGTRLHYVDDLRQADIQLQFGDLAATNKRVDAPLTFTGGGTAMRAPFTLRGTLSTPNSTMVGGRTKLVLHAGVADSIIDVSGTLPGVTVIEGANLHIVAAGKNLQSPFKLLGVTVLSTRPYKLAANLTKTGSTFDLDNLSGHFGDSDIAGELKISRPDGSRLRMDGNLHTKTLSILDVGPFVGYSPEKIDAQGGKAAVTLVDGHPRVLPDAPLAVLGLKPYDAKVHYTADKVSTGTADIRHLLVDFGLDHSKLTLQPLAFDLAGGRLTSDITINARAQPVATDYDIKLSQVPLNKLLTQFKVDESGTTASLRGRIQLHGLGDTVRKSLSTSTGRIAIVFSKGTLWVRNIELVKLDVQNFLTAFLGSRLKKPRIINCGLVAFTVKDGVGQADPVFFDTNRANITGTGQISFVDESIKLSIRGRSKEFSLFSGQSPIGIGGYFAAPKVQPISKQLITRAGVGVSLGLLFPPAAILAFVDFGGAKNSNCAPIEEAKTADTVVRLQPAKLQKQLKTQLKK